MDHTLAAILTQAFGFGIGFGQQIIVLLLQNWANTYKRSPFVAMN